MGELPKTPTPEEDPRDELKQSLKEVLQLPTYIDGKYRNYPCNCDSGKKAKKCCYSPTVLNRNKERQADARAALYKAERELTKKGGTSPALTAIALAVGASIYYPSNKGPKLGGLSSW